MQGKHEIEGVFVPVAGEEENYLLSLSAKDDVCATNLLPGVLPLRSHMASAFEEPSSWPEEVEAYHREKGRAYPPAYRVRISVEWEQVPDEEVEALWRVHELPPIEDES